MVAGQHTLDNMDDVDRALPMAEVPTEAARFGVLEDQFRQLRGPLVAWFRRRVGDAAEAEDLAQDCFLRIARLDDPARVAHLEGYLYQTAKSVLFDRRRRRQVRHADGHVTLQPEHDGIEERDALRAMLAREKLRHVTAVLMTMPERTRSIFVLCRIEGMRYAEVGARFNISVSAVQKHMLRAIETMLQAGQDEA